MREVDISVIVPIHNTQIFITECIESILRQTYPHIEIICVDSSTDRTTSILRQMALMDKRIIHIEDSNSSYGYKVNVGIKLAKGEYIAIVDADDYMEMGMLERLYSIASEHQADMVKSDNTCFYVEDGKNILDQYVANAYRPFFYGKVFSIEEHPEILCMSNPAIWTGLYRKKFLIENEIFLNESEGASYQDSGFAILTHMHAQRIFYLQESYYRYRIDNVDSSVKSQSKYWTVVEEADWIDEQVLKRNITNPNILDAVKIRKINMYYWNYERLDEDYRKRFCDEVHERLVEEFVNNYDTEKWRVITQNRLNVLLAGEGRA